MSPRWIEVRCATYSLLHSLWLLPVVGEIIIVFRIFSNEKSWMWQRVPLHNTKTNSHAHDMNATRPNWYNFEFFFFQFRSHACECVDIMCHNLNVTTSCIKLFAIGEHKLPSNVQLLLIFSSHFGLICMPLFKYVSLNMIEIGSNVHRLIVCDTVSVHRLDLI